MHVNTLLVGKQSSITFADNSALYNNLALFLNIFLAIIYLTYIFMVWGNNDINRMLQEHCV